MKRKERFARAIDRTGPDKVPQSYRDVYPLFQLPPSSWQPREPYYPYIHPLAIRAGVWKSKRTLPKNWLDLDREAIDEWGTIWRVSKISSLGEVVKGALQDGWEGLDDLESPDMTDPARYSLSEKLGKTLGRYRYRLGLNDHSLFERFHFLRGFQNAMMDLIDYPDEVHRLIGKLTDMTLVTVENFHRIGAHGFMLVDDWGTQECSLVSPAHFEEFFEPYYKRITDKCHEYGMHCGIHSCGAIREVIPGLLKAGMDFLQLDSPLMCGIDWLRENVGGKAALFLSPDIQTIYPRGTDEEMEEHIKEMIFKLADFDGGLVAWPYSEPKVIDVPFKRMRLQSKLFNKYGKYPLDAT